MFNHSLVSYSLSYGVFLSNNNSYRLFKRNSIADNNFNLLFISYSDQNNCRMNIMKHKMNKNSKDKNMLLNPSNYIANIYRLFVNENRGFYENRKSFSKEKRDMLIFALSVIAFT